MNTILGYSLIGLVTGIGLVTLIWALWHNQRDAKAHNEANRFFINGLRADRHEHQ